MRKPAFILLAVVGAVLARSSSAVSPRAPAHASSHREAPLISEDPTADNTDLYAFRSPDKPNTLTIVANWIPGEDPAAGPNYYTFSQTARKYNIYIDRNGDGKPDITWTLPVQDADRARTSSATRSRRGRRSGTTRCSRPARRRSTTSARASTEFVGVKDYEAAAQKTIVDEGRRLDLRRPA